jgi:ATP-dependent Clp protease ATP-binding subunit ClpB
MTSNLGSPIFQDVSIPQDKRKDAIVEDVRGYFRPEFVNRIDDIVVFEPLTRDDLRNIVDIQVRLLSERLAQRSLAVELTDEARDYLADAGYDPTFGARPLKRLIQRELQDPLAMKLLSGEIAEGDTVVVDAVEGGLTLGTGKAAPARA